MSLSQLTYSIKESPTETAALLRDKGEPVIHLGGGEPRCKTPIDAILQCRPCMAAAFSVGASLLPRLGTAVLEI